MKKSLFAVLVILSLVVLATAQKDARPAIEAAGKKFTDAIGKGDAAAIAQLYTTNAQTFPPNGEIANGRDAIQEMWQGEIDSGMKGATFKTLEVETFGDTAYEVGTYEITGDGGKHLDHGKYIVVWKREGGSWKLHRDIWNSSMPAPAH
jgi:uncharacterized protein (TIGR02246 family)